MKSEPSEFSIWDLEKRGEAVWDGVRNYQTRNLLRDRMRAGDRALFYHSSAKEIGIVGEMEIVGQAFRDPTQFDAKSKYYDVGSKQEDPRWLSITVKHQRTYKKIISLSVLRAEKNLSELLILKKGTVSQLLNAPEVRDSVGSKQVLFQSTVQSRKLG